MLYSKVLKTNEYSEIKGALNSGKVKETYFTLKDGTKIEGVAEIDPTLYGCVTYYNNIGDQVYSWDIVEIEFIIEFTDPRIEFGSSFVFNPPGSFDREFKPGTYLVRYFNDDTFEISVDIMRIHSNKGVGSIGGMFLFDVKHRYKILSFVEIIL